MNKATPKLATGMKLSSPAAFLGRVPLPLFQKKEKLKALLTGFVLVECTTETTLFLDDFVVGLGDKISNRAFACPLSNVGLVQSIKNFQTDMQIVFSDAFAKSLDVFIDHLEGVKRPMEAVATDFLRHCVEFLRIVRSVRGANLTEFSVKSPVLCSTLIVERSINCALFTDLCHLN